MSNRFHSKYHRSNHHTDTNLTLLLTNPDGSPRNPDSGHDPIASPEHPFMGRFCIKGGLSAITSDTNPDKAAGIFISRNLNEDACRFYGAVKLSGAFILQDNLINADINTHKVGINIEPSTYSGFDLIVNDSVRILENTTTKTLDSNYITINAEGTYPQYPFDIVKASNSNHLFTVLSSGSVGINLGTVPNFESQNLKVIGNTLFDSSNKLFQIKGETEINNTVSNYTTKIGTNAIAGQVSIGRNEIVKFTTAGHVSADCNFILTKNLYLTGDQNIKGNLNIQGNLSALGTFTQLDTIITTTSSMSIYNTGTTTAFTVKQTGNTDIADFKDEIGSILFIDNDRRVGILTDNPTYTLDVVGTCRATEGLKLNGNKDFIIGNDVENSVNDGASIKYQYVNNTNSRLIIRTFDEANEPIVFQQSDNANQYNRLVIGTNGNVGVGMNLLTGIESFPSTLSVYGDLSAIGNINSNGQLSIQRNLNIGRTDTLKEGGQIDLCNAYNNTPAYSIDVYSDVNYSNNERFRIFDNPANTERFTIDKNGNVGIGAVPSNQKLTVIGNVSATGNLTLNTGSYLSFNTLGTETRIARNAALNGMEFFTSNISRLFISDSGNVGIGTSNNDAGCGLHVKGTTVGDDFAIKIENTDQTGYSSLLFGEAQNVSIWRNGNLNTGYAGASSLNIGTIIPSNVGIVTNNITRMLISSAGNVGIGLTNPEQPLHVNGHILLNNSNVIKAKDSTGASNDVLTGRWSDNATYLDGGTGGLYLRYNNGTTGFRMDNSGNIGLGGITTPSVRLDVSGAIRASTSITALGTLGYGTGAGGAVSQGTSRTTPVTLNKICGSITLVSAAGAATWTTFTVNNNLISTTDTIILSYSGGTNTYIIVPGRIVNGVSFQINFVSIVGTAIDAPVINYSIIKSVAA